MAENKTKPTGVSPTKFINELEDLQQRKDCKQLLKMMKAATGEKAVMWGPSIVGFGSCHYKYASGREGDIMRVGFAPRKNQLSLYLSCDIQRSADLLAQLGKYKTGKGCLYIKKLGDVDLDVLAQLIERGIEEAGRVTCRPSGD
ncbi:DUF1801 domain-containing protein [Blastopirellula marina]|uniref:YdhG-like domain-containing protein n=1 Tax=Blastopirellula marina TaxID=124 RepID=A0A2S8F802_9BACT|nr:DUF1801 domain-containing protein [Blastopirellula marina]PQO28292.1 hypothetical protein C5Y98_25695 [Blastopirellula marina]PTL41832.1 DUF1801 domain-containing protein [Blastopirellula marina]